MTEEALQEETQQAEEPQSMREALEEAYAELSTDEPTEETVDETLDETTEEEVEEVEESSENEEEETVTDLEAPRDWSSSEKEAFNELAKVSPEGAEKFLNRFQNMHRGFHEKTQELSKINKLFESRQNEMQRSGVTKEGVIQTVLAWDEFMQKDPEAALKALAKQNNIDLTDIAFGGGDLDDYEDDYESEKMKKLEAKILELEQHNSKVEASQVTATNDQLLQQAQDFANKTDSDGNLMHPYCSDVTAEMATLITNGKSFEEAYETAIWTKPEIREKLLSETPVKKVDSIEAKKARIAKAKKAGKSVTNSGGKKSAVKPNENLSLRDDIKRTYQALSQ